MFSKSIRERVARDLTKKHERLDKLDVQRRKVYEKYLALKAECNELKRDIDNAKNVFGLKSRCKTDADGNRIENKNGNWIFEFYVPDEPEKEDEYI